MGCVCAVFAPARRGSMKRRCGGDRDAPETGRAPTRSGPARKAGHLLGRGCTQKQAPRVAACSLRWLLKAAQERVGRAMDGVSASRAPPLSPRARCCVRRVFPRRDVLQTKSRKSNTRALVHRERLNTPTGSRALTHPQQAGRVKV